MPSRPLEIAATVGGGLFSSNAVSNSGLGSGSPPARTDRGRRARWRPDRLAVVDAGRTTLATSPRTSNPTRSTVPAFSAGRSQLGDRLGHAGGLVADIAGILECLRDLAVGVEGMMSWRRPRPLRRPLYADDADVLRNDLHAVGGVECLGCQRSPNRSGTI